MTDTLQTNRKFNSLLEHIEDGISVATLATTIEEQGIWGWDRFGRTRLFEAGDSGDDGVRYANVLNELAAQYAWEIDSQNIEETESPVQCADHLSSLNFGWYADETPDFSSSQGNTSKSVAPPNPRRNNPKGDNKNKGIIGALLEVIDGTALGDKHPEYQSGAALARDLEKTYKGKVGTEDSLVKKFAEARQMLHDQINHL